MPPFRLRSDLVFSTLYQNNVWKFVSVGFSFLAVVVTLPMLYNIVSFEANNHYRILVLAL